MNFLRACFDPATGRKLTALLAKAVPFVISGWNREREWQTAGKNRACILRGKWNRCLLAASPRFMTIGKTLTLQIAAKGLSVVITSIGFGRTKSKVRSAYGCGLHPGEGVP